MTTLWIANTTKMHNHFLYNLGKGNATPRWIYAGKQIAIEGSEEDMQKIVKQHERYGLQHVDDVDLKHYNGLCYSLNEPVPLDHMLETFEANGRVRAAEAQARREATAARMSAGIAQELHKATGGDPAKLVPERLEVESRDTETDEGTGVEVIKEPDKTPPRRARRE